MLLFVGRRLAWTVVLLLALTLATYVTFFILPTNRARVVRRTGTEAIDIRRAVPLSGNVLQEYGQFVSRAVRGDLGYSFRTREAVSTIMRKAAPTTASLLVGGLILTLLIALPLGALSALRPRSLLDKGGMVIALVGMSLHPVSIGLGLAYLLGHRAGVFPVRGYCDLLSPRTSCGGPVQWLYHLVLPWVTFALVFSALYARMLRSLLLEELGEEHITTARAKGASELRVLLGHALPGALLPVATMVAMDMGRWVLTLVFVEQVFNLPGLGRTLLRALDAGDLPVIVGVTLVIAAGVALLNLVADVLYAVVDPRVRIGARPAGG
jgi:peptide/nickel transport system permease protein